MKSPITFITSNKNKLAQVQSFISVPLLYTHLDLPEIQSLDLQEIVKYKVAEAYKMLGKPVLIEDVSLTIPAFGRLPGPFIKWFLKELQVEGLCTLISQHQDKSAIGEVCYGFHDGSTVHTFSGTVSGHISQSPLGTSGFGWDRIFIPEGYTITRGQMEKEDFEKTSPRKIALAKFEEYLKKK